MTLPGVREAVVSAGTASKGGEIPLCASIVLEEEPTENMTQAERRAKIKEKIDALNQTLPAYKRVSKVRIEKK